MNKQQKNNLFFIIWISILAISIVVVVLLISGKQMSESKPTPTPTDVVPSSSPTPTPSEPFSYSLPRKSNISLNPSLAFDGSIGGSGMDILKGVITLDTYYLFGSTDSKDYDFKSKGDSDIFLAKVGMSGEVISTITFGDVGDEFVIDAKPFPKTSENNKNGVLVFFKNAGKQNSIQVARVTSDLKDCFTTSIELEGDVDSAKVIYTQNGMILLSNVSKPSGKLSCFVSVVPFNLSDITTNELKFSESLEGVDALVMRDEVIILANFLSETKQMCILNFNLKTNEVVITKFAGSYQEGFFLRPKTQGGYIILYKNIVDSVKKCGLLSLDKSYNITFDHKINGGDYDSISIIEDYKQENSLGFFVFATKKTSSGYETFSEYLCSHGDLIYVDTYFLKNILPKTFYKKEDGLTVVGEKYSDNSSDVIVISTDLDNKVIMEKTFGGKGDDKHIFDIINRNGDLTVFTNSSSQSGDISYFFGKNDVWFFQMNH